MGRISAPFGIKGWVKIYPFVTGGATNLKKYPTWYIGSGGDGAGWETISVEATELHGGPDLNHLAAKFAGCSDRDAAAALKGRVIAVPREAFAPVATGEYYWADLIGLAVRNIEGQDFGVVTSMMETGANDVMVVRLGEEVDTNKEERLIPFLTSVIKQVDLASGVIEVDWGLDY